MAALDQETALLIAQMQRDDALAISRGRKGKARAGSALSDEEIAFRLHAQELDAWKQNYQDYTLAKSLHDALEQDAAILDAYRLMEEAAAADRRTAEAISRGRPVPRPTVAQARLENREFSLERASRGNSKTRASGQRAPVASHQAPQINHYEELLGLTWQFDSMSDSLDQAGPSTERIRRVACVSCDTRLRESDALRTHCSHYWCSGCLQSLIEVYLRDESLHPLRCCKNAFKPEDVSSSLRNPRLLKQYTDKRTEFEVPAQNRVYCASPRCSAFLGSSEAQPVGNPDIRCGQCRTMTCSTCRDVSHGGNACKASEAVDLLRELARAEGWQTCPGCSTIVDLHHGCNHMTCHCRAEFCFLCGVRWKNCACPQWNEERLIETARMRAQNDLGADVRAAEPLRFFRAVNVMAENMRTRHDCDPHRWRNTGAGDCEECGDHLPLFLKMCRNCNLTVCRRCSLNRM